MHLRGEDADEHEDRTIPRSTDTDSGALSHMVVALFHDRADARDAVEALREAGFDDERLGVAVPGRDGAPLSPRARTGVTPRTAQHGELAGGVLGLLAGVGTTVEPGIGTVIAAGWLGSMLLGTSHGAGGILGVLQASGLPDRDVEHFEAGMQAGGALVTVHADGRLLEARLILREYGSDLGPTAFSELIHGDGDGDRRYHDDLSYSGPERRFSA